MSKYTTELRYICQNLANSEDDTSKDAYVYVVEHSCDKLFDFDIGLREDHWNNIKRLFIHTYYRREIGFETYGEFKRRLVTKCEQLSIKYINLYKTWDNLLSKNVDMFNNVDYTDIVTSSSESDSETTFKPETKTTSKTKSKFNDTPMGQIETTEDERYLTNLTIGDNEVSTSGTDTTNTNGKNKGSTERVVKGKNGGLTYAELMAQYKDSVMNIDMMFVNELFDLFMLIY